MNRFKLLFPFLILPILTTCTLDTEYFKDYKDLNLIGNMPLGGAWPDGTPFWQTLTYKEALGIDPYMNWEAMTTVSPPADAPPGAAVYRLEIKNLIPNGDFTDTITPLPWTTAGTSRAVIEAATVIPGDPNQDLDYFTPVRPTGADNSLWLTVRNSSDSVSFDLSPYAVDTVNQLYLLRLKYRSYSSIAYKFGQDYALDKFIDVSYKMMGLPELKNKTLPVVATIPDSNNLPAPFSFSAGIPHSLTFKGDKVVEQNLAIDDLQMVNVTQNTAVSLKVPSINDTQKPLLQGALYTFSIAVKDEEVSALTPLTANAYAAEALTVKIWFIDNSFANKSRLTFDLADFNTLNFPISYTPGAGDPPVLQIDISPTEELNLSTLTCGRLLISDPQFIFREKR